LHPFLHTVTAVACFRPEPNGFELTYELPQERSCGIFLLIFWRGILEKVKFAGNLSSAAWSRTVKRPRQTAAADAQGG
jgi:hypothetical protein